MAGAIAGALAQVERSERRRGPRRRPPSSSSAARSSCQAARRDAAAPIHDASPQPGGGALRMAQAHRAGRRRPRVGLATARAAPVAEGDEQREAVEAPTRAAPGRRHPRSRSGPLRRGSRGCRMGLGAARVEVRWSGGSLRPRRSVSRATCLAPRLDNRLIGPGILTKPLTTAHPAREGIGITTSSGIVAEIKSKLPVVEVVGETVAAQAAGTVHKGLCPFHAEKTPSFIVTPERETWHCFGCGEHGDIFTFVMRRDGLDFREALSRLAEKAGVELSERTAGEDRRRSASARRSRRRSPGIARSSSRRTRPSGRAATSRSAASPRRRWIASASATRRTPGRRSTKRLRAKGFTDGGADRCRASPARRAGGVYDRFRGRIIIPIRDASGRAIGLGGRILPDAEGPKYLNSPATALFDKSRTLYGIDLAKGAIRREKLAVIVEGYTDVMAAHQAGFDERRRQPGDGADRRPGRAREPLRRCGRAGLRRRPRRRGGDAARPARGARAGRQQGAGDPHPGRQGPGRADPDRSGRAGAAVADAAELLPYFMQRARARSTCARRQGAASYTRRMLDLLRRSRTGRAGLVRAAAGAAGRDRRAGPPRRARARRRGADPSAVGSPATRAPGRALGSRRSSARR